jgi:2,3-bisphosphoglycerate-independent phosphoglycerate mutase
MKILLKSTFGSVDESGTLTVSKVKDKDCEYLAEAIGWIEIDGVRFDASMKGDFLEITMSGPDLSPDVTANYTAKINVVKQIVHRAPGGKFTSSVLNKYIRRTNKMLSREPCNRGKKDPPNIILVREIEAIE